MASSACATQNGHPRCTTKIIHTAAAARPASNRSMPTVTPGLCEKDNCSRQARYCALVILTSNDSQSVLRPTSSYQMYRSKICFAGDLQYIQARHRQPTPWRDAPLLMFLLDGVQGLIFPDGRPRHFLTSSHPGPPSNRDLAETETVPPLVSGYAVTRSHGTDLGRCGKSPERSKSGSGSVRSKLRNADSVDSSRTAGRSFRTGNSGRGTAVTPSRPL